MREREEKKATKPGINQNGNTLPLLNIGLIIDFEFYANNEELFPLCVNVLCPFDQRWQLEQNGVGCALYWKRIHVRIHIEAAASKRMIT